MHGRDRGARGRAGAVEKGAQLTTHFVGWTGLALINAALANIDGRGPLKYFLGSLAFGPFVTIVLAATREDGRGALRQVDLWKGSPRASK